jgi:hypothetical protein
MRESAYCTITGAVYNTIQFLSVWSDADPRDATTPELRLAERSANLRHRRVRLVYGK